MPIDDMDQERQAEMLETYCESVTADPSAQPPAGLQSALAETAHRLAADLSVLQAEPAFAKELQQRLAAQARALAHGQAKAPVIIRLNTALGHRQWFRCLWVLGGVAAVAALLLLVVSQPRPGGGERLGRIIPLTSAPAATLAPGSTTAPGIPPLPDWLQTGELVANNQGMTLAYLRAIIHQPRFIVVFVGVGGPLAADGSPYLPVDLRVLDPAGHEYPCQVTWLDSTGGVSVGAVTLAQVDPAIASLRLRVSEMRTAQGQTLRGSWQIEPIRRFQPGAAISPDRLANLDGLQCFQNGDVTISNGCFTPCSPSAPAVPPPMQFVPRTDAGPATLAPTANAGPATATPPPLQGAPATVVPFPTQPPAPLAPTAAPTALPHATATPVMPLCEFTDWTHGLIGTTLYVNGPQPHAIYVLIARESGQVRRVSEQEFAEARQRAH